MTQGGKPRRTISVANIQQIRIHCINIRTDWDEFKLTATAENPTAIEELWTFIGVPHSCVTRSTDAQQPTYGVICRADASRVERTRDRAFPVQTILEEIQRCCEWGPQGQILGIAPGERSKVAALVARCEVAHTHMHPCNIWFHHDACVNRLARLLATAPFCACRGKRVLELIDMNGGVQSDREPVYEKALKKTLRVANRYGTRVVRCTGTTMEIFKVAGGGAP